MDFALRLGVNEKAPGMSMISITSDEFDNASAQQARSAVVLVSGAAIVLCAAALLVYGATSRAVAVPSFARQTGQPCMSCHTAFPELTPFGRRFKLGGYTLGGGKGIEDGAPPIAAMLVPTFARTRKGQDAPPTTDTHTNNNLVLQQASLFYAGKIYGNLGAFVQTTYDRASQHFMLDNTDIRYADTASLGGLEALYGVSLHNGPTVQDVWNTTPAWGYPYVSSSLAPQFSPPGAQIEGNFAAGAVGTTAYVMLNDTVYLEAGGYHPMSLALRRALGNPCANNAVRVNTQLAIDAIVNPLNNPPFYPWYGPQGLCSADSLAGFAPYWRVAIEPNWGPHSLMVGAFGFYPRVNPGSVGGFGVDSYSDLGLDAQYQYIDGPHALTLKLSRIVENQNLQSTFNQGLAVNVLGLPANLAANGGSTNLRNTLTSFRATAQYVWDHTIAGSVSYFNVHGTNDAVLYGGNSLTNSPNGKGLTFELSYMPFNKGGPSVWPWANAKIGVQYTHYLQMFGANGNFDGMLHNASDNDTVLLYSWIAF